MAKHMRHETSTPAPAPTPSPAPARKASIWGLLVATCIPLAAGMTVKLLTPGSSSQLSALAKPPYMPPTRTFPVVWTLLCVLMGVASYQLWLHRDKGRNGHHDGAWALVLYGLQLVLNALWPVLFFWTELYYAAFGWLVVLWIVVALLILRARRVSKTAALLFVPCLLWITYAGYLNLGIALLN